MARSPARRSGGKQPAPFAQRFRQRIVRQYFVRFHMSLILAATTASALLASKLLLMAGLQSVLWRYPLALALAYLGFFGLTRLWVSYVLMGRPGGGSALRFADGVTSNLDLPDLGAGSSGPAEHFSFGGGDSGGGGASSTWDAAGDAVAPGAPSGGGGAWFPSLDLDIDLDEGIWILVALAALVIVLIASGGYLIYAAPSILPDAACQALLAGCLTGAAQRAQSGGWARSLWRSTRIPLVLVLGLTLALGWTIQHSCPAATKLSEALSCQDAGGSSAP